jgi:quercetin dioxygenase-like cupin family protein
MKSMHIASVAALALAAAVVVAQAPAIKRNVLQRMDIEGNREVILGMAEIAQGGTTGRHTHPGVETAYVVDGELELMVEGVGTKVVKAGESYSIPLGRVHSGTAHGSGATKVLVTYVVEKGKPLASPAP